jgi:hypothetical protein
MDAERRTSLAVVRRALGRARLIQLGFAVFVAVLGCIPLIGFDDRPTLTSKIVVGGIGGFLLLLAAVSLWAALVKSNPNRSPLIRALLEHPDDVVWLYESETAITVNGIEAPVSDTNIIAGLADGKTIAITIKKPNAAALLDALKALAPRATIGFTPERQAQFKRDPRSLCG